MNDRLTLQPGTFVAASPDEYLPVAQLDGISGPAFYCFASCGFIASQFNPLWLDRRSVSDPLAGAAHAQQCRSGFAVRAADRHFYVFISPVHAA